MLSRTQAASPYMNFAKLRSAAKYNLATSGIMSYPISGLPVRLEDLEICGPTLYGYAPLVERIAKRAAVPTECVVTASGTSLANHLAFAAIVEPGDEVLVETPTYELLVTTLEFLGVKVRYFERRMEQGFAVDPEEVERKITPQTRLIVLTNLHNPTGAYADDLTLRAVGEIARKQNAYVLVDEVYLEMLYEQRPKPAIHLGDQFVVTSSLTKAFGLSGLRCGWIMANPDLAQRMWRINDLFGVNAAFPADLLSVIALDNLDRVSERSMKILEENRPVLNRFLDACGSVDCVRSDFGTVAFPKLKRGCVETLDRLLREKYDTAVVPGGYFYMPQHFRVGIGGDPAMTREAFERLAAALAEMEKSA